MFLCETIDSVLTQSLTDFELLIIDDGSTDSSVHLISDYMSDERVKLFRNQRNIGLPGTLRKGVELSSGEWIARIDQDDLMSPHRLERQLSFAKCNSLDICGSWADLIDADGRSFGELRVPRSHAEILFAMRFQNPFIHSTVIFRRDLAKRTNQTYSFDRRIIVEDFDLWSRFALGGARMGSIGSKLVKYRVHSNSITSNNISAMNHAREEVIRIYLKKVKESDAMSSVYRDVYFNVALRSPIFFIKMWSKFLLNRVVRR